jgi:hypothetical protein
MLDSVRDDRSLVSNMAWRLPVIIILVLILAAPLNGLAEGPARVYLEPVPLQDEKQFVVNVLVADVADLYGAEVQLAYNPAQLQVDDANPRLEGTQISPGPFLAADERFVVTNRVDADSGLVTFVVTLLNPAPAVSGGGVLATVAFRIVGAGPYAVDVVKAQLVSSGMSSIAVVAENLLLPTTGQPSTGPVVAFPRHGMPDWGWWAIGIACLSLVVLGVASWRRAGRSATPAAVSRGGAQVAPEHTSTEMSAAMTEQAKRAMNRGDLELAHELFSRAVERDPANADAWLGKGLVAQQVAEKRICFRRVLALDPGNAVAQVELKQVAGS